MVTQASLIRILDPDLTKSEILIEYKPSRLIKRAKLSGPILFWLQLEFGSAAGRELIATRVLRIDLGNQLFDKIFKINLQKPKTEIMTIVVK